MNKTKTKTKTVKPKKPKTLAAQEELKKAKLFERASLFLTDFREIYKIEKLERNKDLKFLVAEYKKLQKEMADKKLDNDWIKLYFAVFFAYTVMIDRS